MAKSGENVNELMSQMSAMRRDGPQLIAEWMEKEKKALQKNLKTTKYVLDDGQDENVKIRDKKYILDALEETRLKTPANLREKHIELNTKTEALHKALEILKKK